MIRKQRKGGINTQKKIGAQQIKTYEITNTDLTKEGQRNKGTDSNKATSLDKELDKMSNEELYNHIALGLKGGLALLKKKMVPNQRKLIAQCIAL